MYIFCHFFFLRYETKRKSVLIQVFFVPLAMPKVLQFGKTQIHLVFLSLFRTFAATYIFNIKHGSETKQVYYTELPAVSSGEW